MTLLKPSETARRRRVAQKRHAKCGKADGDCLQAQGMTLMKPSETAEAANQAGLVEP
jgi:hypothetical protein